MAASEFYDDVRRACKLLKPHVAGDNGLSAEATSAKLSRSALWLTPHVVGRYDALDFVHLEPEQRKELDAAVRQFAAAASSAPADEPAADPEYAKGREKLEALIRTVRSLVLEEWQTAIAGLISQATEWCHDHGWSAVTFRKNLREELLENYDVEGLRFQADGLSFTLEPVARFVVAAEGLVDLCEMSSYASVTVARREGRWFLQIENGKRAVSSLRKPWTESGFVEAVEWLSRQAAAGAMSASNV